MVIWIEISFACELIRMAKLDESVASVDMNKHVWMVSSFVLVYLVALLWRFGEEG